MYVNPNVKLTVTSGDYSQYAWARVKHIYNVYVTTSEYSDATGQCTQGKLPKLPGRLGGRRLENSDGVRFPSGDDVKVSKQQAEEACAGLGEQKDNCVTDLRMVNEPDAVAKIKEDFEEVESTLKKLTTTTTTTTTMSTTTTTMSTTTTKAMDNKPIDGDNEESGDDGDGTTTKLAVVDASGMTHLCVTVLALVTLVVA